MAEPATTIERRDTGAGPSARQHPTRLSRGLRSTLGIPRAAWTCFLIAWLSATCWAFITPPFQVPDEPSHFAYVKQLAETGSRPSGTYQSPSAEESDALKLLHYSAVRLDPAEPAILTAEQQSTLQTTLAALNHSGRTGSPNAGVATAEPPLYYAIESGPYLLGSSGTLLDRLQLMRLLSALMAGFTAMFTYLFVRETLPGARWAWCVGGLATAFVPLLGFMSGAVNPDAMLFATSAALFYCLARAFRRGLTSRSAIATGLVLALGFATKLSFVGLAPGAYLALVAIAVQERRRIGTRAALTRTAFAALIGCVPIVLLLTVGSVAGHSAFENPTSTVASVSGSLLDRIDYIWQLYLPRLPGTTDYFPGISSTRQLWFDHYVGQFGWLDTAFPRWVDTAALVPATLIAALCIRTLLSRRALLRERAPELLAYAVMALGALVLVGAASYVEFPKRIAAYGQARYLLPLLPLLAVTLTLAARGAGRRWGPSVGVLIVLLFLAHDVFSQLQTVARFYV